MGRESSKENRPGENMNYWTMKNSVTCLFDSTLSFVWVSVNNGAFHFSIKHDILGRRFASVWAGWVMSRVGNDRVGTWPGGRGRGGKVRWESAGGRRRGGGEDAGGGGRLDPSDITGTNGKAWVGIFICSPSTLWYRRKPDLYFNNIPFRPLQKEGIIRLPGSILHRICAGIC